MASIFSLILLLSLSISTLATSKINESGSNFLRSTCGKTPEPELCVENLSVFSESKTADIHELTVLSVRALTHCASTTSQLILINMGKSNDNTPLQATQCLMDCSKAITDAIQTLGDLSYAVNDRKSTDIDAWVSETSSSAFTCNQSCKSGKELIMKAIVHMTDKISKLCNVTLALAKLDEKE